MTRASPPRVRAWAASSRIQCVNSALDGSILSKSRDRYAQEDPANRKLSHTWTATPDGE